MQGLFAGLDVSTQSCKLVVIDLAAGTPVHVDAVRYDDDLPAYDTHDGAVRGLPAGHSESDPRMWLEAVEMLLARLAEARVDAAAIRCISVSGQQHGLVALDAEGRLARPRAKLWNDFSTARECRVLTERVGGTEQMLAEVSNIQRTGYTAPKILHMLRNEPDAYARTATVLLPHNYVNWHLTGGPGSGAAVLEPGDASGLALWNPATHDWSSAVIDAIDPGLRAKLPPVLPADRTIGTVGAELAARFGLSLDCRVDAGSGDNMYAALGTGNFVPGIVTVSLGTSGTACTVTEKPFVDPTGEISSYCDSTGAYLPLLCVSNMSNGYNAALEHFALTHTEFEALVSATAPGNRGRVLVPWYEGERTPDVPLAGALYFGFAVEDFTPERLCRAVLEGHVMNLHAGFERFPVKPEVLHLTGGLAASPSWQQTIADVFEVETVPVPGEGAAMGAALHAAWVWHREHGHEVTLSELAGPFVIPDERCRRQPDASAAEVYRVQKRLFAAVSRRARGLESEDPFAIRDELLRGTA